LTGTCNPKKEEKRSSEPLAPEQFLSAFFLLMCGVLLSAGLCGLEHVYFKYIRNNVNKTDKAGCCALISLVRTFILKHFEQNLSILVCKLSEQNYVTECWKILDIPRDSV
jgi:hypothetical protein